MGRAGRIRGRTLGRRACRPTWSRCPIPPRPLRSGSEERRRGGWRRDTDRVRVTIRGVEQSQGAGGGQGDQAGGLGEPDKGKPANGGSRRTRQERREFAAARRSNPSRWMGHRRTPDTSASGLNSELAMPPRWPRGGRRVGRQNDGKTGLKELTPWNNEMTQ